MELVNDAVQNGDEDTARLALSRCGKNALANAVGRENAEQLWPNIRKAAVAAAFEHAPKDGDIAEARSAMASAEQARKALVAGIHLADLRSGRRSAARTERLAQARRNVPAVTPWER